LQGSPRGLERKEAHPWLDEPFHEAMVLLDQVVEVLTLPQFTMVWLDPFRSQFLKSFGIGRVFINRNERRDRGTSTPFSLSHRSHRHATSRMSF
jgi:hypothetical protein